jgi:single-strand DNA-binding protein
MASVNKVILIGNLGNDPEVKYLNADTVVANFNIATTEKYTDRNGQKVEQTEWHRIELWGDQAKTAEKYLKKGNPVYIEGKIRTEKWTDKDGNERSTVKVRATLMTLLGSRNNEGGSNFSDQPSYNSSPVQKNAPKSVESSTFVDNGGGDDDLPF